MYTLTSSFSDLGTALFESIGQTLCTRVLVFKDAEDGQEHWEHTSTIVCLSVTTNRKFSVTHNRSFSDL